MTNEVATRQNMDNAVTNQVAAGYRVESQTASQSVLVKGKRVNHALHAIVTFFTMGFWAPFWLAIALLGGEKRIILRTDDSGNVLHQSV